MMEADPGGKGARERFQVMENHAFEKSSRLLDRGKDPGKLLSARTKVPHFDSLLAQAQKNPNFYNKRGINSPV